MRPYFIISTRGHEGDRPSTGADVEIRFIDDRGRVHVVPNVRSFRVSCDGHSEPVRLELEILGADIDITADMAATMLRVAEEKENT